jgi:hypothetical protein
MLVGHFKRLPTLLTVLLLACSDGAGAGESLDEDEEESEDDEREEDEEQGEDPDDEPDDVESELDGGKDDDDSENPDSDVDLHDAATTDDTELDAGNRDAGSDDEPPPFSPAFHIPLRVHRGDSGLTARVLASVLEEVNQIWWKQAAVCFEIEIVHDDAEAPDGFDLWFHRKTLGCDTVANGVYCGDHDVHSLDAPSLGAANNAEWNVRLLPARTAAHELGHGLNLPHYNGFADSNDSLMSSGRQGFKLHDSEVAIARKRAQQKADGVGPSTPCAPVPVVD